MANKNRIEQPWGYREQNKFNSEPAMICKAITSKNPSHQEIIEKINFILSHGFFDVNYDRGLESYSFNNAEGRLIGAAKLFDIIPSDLITDMGYNQETKKIFVAFDNDQTLEIPLDALISHVEEIVGEEATERAAEDRLIWDAIGDLSGSTATSGKSLLDMIKEEISARTEGDDDLWAALSAETQAREANDAWLNNKINDEVGAEASARTDEDQRLWDAIGDLGISGTSLVEMLQQEIADRTNGDDDLWAALSAETSARTDEDQRIWDAIGDLGTSGTSLADMLQQEIADRTNGDNDLLAALNAEISARTDGDNDLWDALHAEESARTEADNAISGAVDVEKEEREANDAWLRDKIYAEESARISGDNAIWDALNAEISARTDGDNTLNESIRQEGIDRAREDGVLSGAIDTERTERIASDNVLSGKIDQERNDRENGDAALTNAIGTEGNERIAEDNRIWAALSSETQSRIAGDVALSGMVNNNKVSIVKVNTSLPSNVREAYELKNTLGEILGERINIYKDSSLKNVELVDYYQGRQGQFLKFTYILDDGTEKVEFVDVSMFLVEAEFKDGLVVTNAGEVKVKIDTSSDPYLTVSTNGVRLSGVTEISNKLNAEIERSRNADTALEGAILTEQARAMNAETALTAAIEEEVSRATEAERLLDASIRTEKERAMTVESDLHNEIGGERTQRETYDQQLYNQITGLSGSLDEERRQRISSDDSIQGQVRDLQNADITINGRITTLDGRVTTEVARLDATDVRLENELGLKVNKSEVYTRTQADDIFARKTEIPTDFYTKLEVDTKDNEIKALITAETAAREAEDAALNNAITAETDAREDADERLQGEIDTLSGQINSKLVAIVNNDLSINVDNTDPTIPVIKTNISRDANQILKLNADGLYVKATLDYDSSRNELTFTTSNAEPKRIQIQSQSEIDNIYYDSSREEIVIEYTVNGSRKEDVRVPVGDLIEEWRVEDGNQGAIALSKSRRPGGDKDVLSARLVLNTAHSDNAAIIDDNALYVSKTAITANADAEIASLKARVLALEQALSAATLEHQQFSTDIAAVQSKNQDQDVYINANTAINASQQTAIDQLINYIDVDEGIEP